MMPPASSKISRMIQLGSAKEAHYPYPLNSIPRVRSNSIIQFPISNAGIAVVAISCDQSLRSDASPIPSTVRFSQRGAFDGEVKTATPRKIG